MTRYDGACHCGRVTVEFETAVPPADAEVRACQCSFCRMHGSLAVSDPAGSLRFREREPGAIRNYALGLRTADYVLCGTCGVYMGAVMRGSENQGFGIVNTRVLARQSDFIRSPKAAVYDDEDVAQRTARRRERWTPLATR